MKNKLYKTFFIISFLFVGVLLISCEKKEMPSKSGLKPNEISTVNGEIINTESFISELKLTRRKYRVEDKNDITEKETMFLKLKTLNGVYLGLYNIYDSSESRLPQLPSPKHSFSIFIASFNEHS